MDLVSFFNELEQMAKVPDLDPSDAVIEGTILVFFVKELLKLSLSDKHDPELLESISNEINYDVKTSQIRSFYDRFAGMTYGELHAKHAEVEDKIFKWDRNNFDHHKKAMNEIKLAVLRVLMLGQIEEFKSRVQSGYINLEAI